MKLNNFRSILFKKDIQNILFVSKEIKIYFEFIFKDTQREIVCLKSIISNSSEIILDKTYYYSVESNCLYLKDKQDLFKTNFLIEEIHIIEPQDPIPIFEKVPSKTFSLKFKNINISKDFRKKIQEIIFNSGGLYDKSYDLYIFEEPVSSIYRYIEESRK
jgi:DNA-binding cell septation regulator SpoVG